jgi:hypothetical protein
MSDAPSPSGDGHAPDDAASGAPDDAADAFIARGEAIFDAKVRHDLPPEAPLHAFLAIDVATGAFEIDEDDPLAAERRLHARCPDAEGRTWTRRVGSPITYALGARIPYADPRPDAPHEPRATDEHA